MLPESMAPPLERYDEFKAFMAEHNIRLHRTYAPEWIDPETGEELGDFWQILMYRECPMRDGRIWHRDITVPDYVVTHDFIWQQQVDLFEMAWKYDLQEQDIDG